MNLSSDYFDLKNKNKRIKIRPGVRLIIAAEQKYCCCFCNNVLGAIFHIDHKIALCNGGDNSLKNLCALCANCHMRKTAIDLQRFYDKKTEIRTGKSRFFEPFAAEYIEPRRCL